MLRLLSLAPRAELRVGTSSVDNPGGAVLNPDAYSCKVTKVRLRVSYGS